MLPKVLEVESTGSLQLCISQALILKHLSVGNVEEVEIPSVQALYVSFAVAHKHPTVREVEILGRGRQQPLHQPCTPSQASPWKTVKSKNCASSRF